MDGSRVRPIQSIHQLTLPSTPLPQRGSFGWLFPSQQILLAHVLGEGTRVIVQLGAYLGKTTLFIAERAPKVRGWFVCLCVRVRDPVCLGPLR